MFVEEVAGPWLLNARRFMVLSGEWARLKREHRDESAAIAAYQRLCGEQTRRWRQEDRTA